MRSSLPAFRTHTRRGNFTCVPTIEAVESRLLLAADTISILGTAAADVINVSQAGTVLTVKLNSTTKTYSTVGKTKLSVAGGDGDDVLNVALSVKLNATLDGGNGKDKLHGGGAIDTYIGGADTDFVDYADSPVGVKVTLDGIANDGPGGVENVRSDVENVIGSAFVDTLYGNSQPNVLVGNGGGDLLKGMAGRDVLIGGLGSDTLDGGIDDDLLIASRTVYDANLPALRTLGFEWRNPANAYATRISRLKTGVLGVKIDKANVPADLAGDSLTGGTATDWFVTHWGDVLKDRVTAETTTLLSSPIRWISQTRSVNLNAFAGDAEQTKTKSATGFGPFSAKVESNLSDSTETATVSAEQVSSLTDTRISFAGDTDVGGYNGGGGNATTSFSVKFVLDEPRAYNLAWSALWYEDGYWQFVGNYQLKLVKTGSSAAVFNVFATQPTDYSGNPSGFKAGTLAAGQYTLTASAYSVGGGSPELSMWAGLDFTLNTTPAGE